MIIDKLTHINNYLELIPELCAIEKFITDFNKSPKEAGKYEIDGDKLFAMVQSYTTKPLSEGKPEAHRDYIDLQYVVSGTEEMLVAPIDSLTLVEERYSTGSDVAFYEGELTAKAVFSEGDFAVFFTNDVHCPGIMHNKPESVVKIVFKIKVK